MLVTINGVETSSETVQSGAFGVNFEFNFQSFGDRPWDKFDEIVEDFGPSQIRFPAGTYTETIFDINNPDATSYVDSDGNTRELVPMTDMLNFAKANNTNAVVVIPTAFALGAADSSGMRIFDPDAGPVVANYVRYLLDLAGDSTLSRLEIGNEYAGYMTSREYGRIASEMAKIIQDTIDDYRAEKGLGPEWQEPDIGVQILGQSVNGGLTLEDLDKRNQVVLDEFNAEELAAVDAVVDHFYYYEGRNAGGINEHSFENLERAVSLTTARADIWQRATTQDLKHVYSEWNTSHHTVDISGLRQIPYVMKLFSELVQDGVDELDHWSTQYHLSSLYNESDDPLIIGRVFTEFRDQIEGAQIVDIAESNEDVTISGFKKGDVLTLFISSMTANDLAFDIDATMLGAFNVLGATQISVDATSADGVYKGYTDLPIYSEPDVTFNFDAVPNASEALAGLNGISLEAYETLVITLEAPNVVEARTEPDPSMNPTELSGALEAGVVAQAFPANQYTLTGESETPVVLNGDDGPDTIFGGSGQEVLNGQAAADLLDGGDGDDQLFGGAGNDILFGGSGNDQLTGGDGDDELYGGGGKDIFVFEAFSGQDVVHDFTLFEDQVDLGYLSRDVDARWTNTGLVLSDDSGASLTLNGVSETDLSHIVDLTPDQTLTLL